MDTTFAPECHQQRDAVLPRAERVLLLSGRLLLLLGHRRSHRQARVYQRLLQANEVCGRYVHLKVAIVIRLRVTPFYLLLSHLVRQCTFLDAFRHLLR